MPLNVYYSKPFGCATLSESTSDGVVRYRIEIVHANCLCAMIWWHKDKDESGEETKTYQLIGFVSDAEHLKRMLKDGWFANWDNFIFHTSNLDTDYWNMKDFWKMIKLLVNNGKRVTIEPNKGSKN